jgi:release factor glutamine methyltransferase
MQEIWTIQKVLNWTVEYFQNRQVPDARLSAELLLSWILHLKRMDLYLQFERILTPAELAQFKELIQRRSRYEPVQYILGEQEFMGLTFTITPAVLIPRPETELLIEAALNEIQSRNNHHLNILDVGTGSGAIAISLAHFCGKCSVTANDISSPALELARKNAENLGTDNVKFILAEAMKLPGLLHDKFHIIVSNPPYVSENHYLELHPQIRNYEPRDALWGGKDGLDFYRSFIPAVPELLVKDGTLFLEIGYDQKDEIYKMLSDLPAKHIDFIRDYQKIDRIVKAVI